MKLFKYLPLLLFAFATLFGNMSCKKDDAGSFTPESYIILDKPSARLNVGSELELRPQFGEGIKPGRAYQWTSSDPTVADVAGNSDFSAKITAKKEGQAEIKISSADGEIYAVCQVIVTNELPVYRILAIGNSFSEDALEGHLYELAKDAGIKVVIGNLYIGGASLDLHWQNAGSNSAAYEYRKIDQEGKRTKTVNTAIATALADEKWDYISFQQVSQNSGQFDTYKAPLPPLFNYVKQRATNPNVQYIFHQTWAYAVNSTHTGFVNYGNDQLTMYHAIVDAVEKAKGLADFDLVVPSGTAIQNGRTSVLGEQFTRDGYHLDLNLGRYTAACTWFETVFGRSVLGNLYKPAALSSFETEIAKQAAHLAVQNPGAITDMVDYKGGFGILKDPVFVAFGMSAPVPGWNGFVTESGLRMGATLSDLKDKAGNNTRLSLTITEEFNGRNTAGESVTTTEFNMPREVSVNSYFGNAGDAWSGKVVKQSSFKITGLNKDKKYNFCFFGSRSGSGDNRETLFTVKGLNESSSAINTSSNKNKIACVEGIQPKINGEITVTVGAGPNNNNGNKFFYCSAMRITAGN